MQFNGKRKVFSTGDTGINGYPYTKKKSLDNYLTL